MSNATMKAIQAQDYGGSEVLVLEQAPLAEPKADQVLIRLKAAGVNPADWKYRSGIYKQFMPLTFPWTPGLEGSGVVEAKQLKPVMGTVFPLAEARQAHELSQTGHGRGRIILQIA